MKNLIKFIPCLILISFTCATYAETKKSSAALESKDCGNSCGSNSNCAKRAHARALEISNAIDQTFPLAQPDTAEEGAAAFASFFAKRGVFQSPGGILRGKTEIFEGILAYGQNPGETDQHVVTRKSYWDPKTATLVLERTWFATLTAPRNFCGTVLNAGDTYTQDDAVVIRFACDKNCKGNCVLPGDVVYYREYFDPNQFQSNFTSVYPTPCQNLE